MKREPPVFPDGFRDEKLPSGYLSSSQYGLYKRCPTAFEFSYVQGIKAPPGAAAHKGMSIHAGVETAHRHMMEKNVIPPLEMGRAAVVTAFDSVPADGIVWEDDEKPGKVKDAALAAYAEYHNRGLPTVRPVQVEQVFLKKVGTVPVLGYIDLIDHPQIVRAGVTGPGVLVVSDLKCTKAAWSQDDIDRDPQFTLYSLVTGIAAVRVDNLVTRAKGVELVRKESLRTPHDKELLVDEYEETADLIKRGIFPKAPLDSWGCSQKWCGYWSRCRGKRR